MFDIVFQLQITYPEHCKDDVVAAFWAWETFGGIGGRTRRGFGALQLLSVNATQVATPKPSNVAKIIENGLTAHVVEGDSWPTGIPHLNQTMLQVKVVPRPSHAKRWDALDAWDHLIEALSNFRQARPGRGTSHPGRSKWTEPDALRRFTGRASIAHKVPVSKLDKVPRAVFGLPVVFHFKDASAGDPPDTILQGEKFERLASPLILRPLVCTGGEAVGVAIILNALRIPPGDLILKDAKSDQIYKNLGITDVLLSASEAATIAPLKAQSDVLQAFLNTL